ncbi:MAG: Uma2 family endonuclease [Byssovorax sp.]
MTTSSPSNPGHRPHGGRPIIQPAVDERLVMPETRYEAIDGRIHYVCPSDEPHGTYHSKIAALLEAHVAGDYLVAVDMLTRTSEKNDMAPDASVFPAERDPETGGRRLEELAFEVVSTEALSHAGKKARALIERGVRRVFAIDVERQRALEWSRETGAWEILGVDARIEDRALALALPLRALTEAGKADDAVARALLGKKNPVIVEALGAARVEGKAEGKIEGKAEGKIEGKIEAILQVLAVRGLAVSKDVEQQIRAERRAEVVDRWLASAVTCASAEALLGR